MQRPLGVVPAAGPGRRRTAGSGMTLDAASATASYIGTGASFIAPGGAAETPGLP